MEIHKKSAIKSSLMKPRRLSVEGAHENGISSMKNGSWGGMKMLAGRGSKYVSKN